MRLCYRLFPPLLLAAALTLGGCAAPAAPSSPAPDGPAYTFTDDLGRQVVLDAPPRRVAAGMGSFAQVWLLAGGQLAAATRDAWEEGGITRDGRVPGLEGSQPSDSPIVDLGSLKKPSVETMVEAGVDFVLLSAKLEEHLQLQDQLEALGIPCAYFEVELFQDYLEMLKVCTDLTGREDLYRQHGADVADRIQGAVRRGAGQEGSTVLFIRAFATGARAKGSDNMTGAMLRDLGCVNIADRQGSLLEDLSLEIIIQEDPDFILVVTMGEDPQKALDSMKTLLEDNPAFGGLSAVRDGRYLLLPKDLFHLKPNHRWGESYEYLADVLYGPTT